MRSLKDKEIPVISPTELAHQARIAALQKRGRRKAKNMARMTDTKIEAKGTGRHR